MLSDEEKAKRKQRLQNRKLAERITYDISTAGDEARTFCDRIVLMDGTRAMGGWSVVAFEKRIEKHLN